MASKQFLENNPVAVLGAGKFGIAIANLIAPNVSHVLLYTHRALDAKIGIISSQLSANNILLTNDLDKVLKSCGLIFPIVPAAKFRGLMQEIAPGLGTHHMLIHGTKGLDVRPYDTLCTRSHIATMSEVIMQETKVEQIGCLAGPNLSQELGKNHPAATVIASSVPKVLAVGKQTLKRNWFSVYTSDHLLSVEMCGVLKNIFAIGAGIVQGMGYQCNTYAFFLTMALGEMEEIISTIGVSTSALLGPAGIGDLIATCGSTSSRNYKIGYRLAQGEQLVDILQGSQEACEGVQTVQTIYRLMRFYETEVPITSIIYSILFEELSVAHFRHLLIHENV